MRSNPPHWPARLLVHIVILARLVPLDAQLALDTRPARSLCFLLGYVERGAFDLPSALFSALTHTVELESPFLSDKHHKRAVRYQWPLASASSRLASPEGYLKVRGDSSCAVSQPDPVMPNDYSRGTRPSCTAWASRDFKSLSLRLGHCWHSLFVDNGGNCTIDARNLTTCPPPANRVTLKLVSEKSPAAAQSSLRHLSI